MSFEYKTQKTDIGNQLQYIFTLFTGHHTQSPWALPTVRSRTCSHITRRYQLHQPRPAPHPPSHRLQNQDPGHAQGHNSCKMGCWQLQSVTLRFIVEKDLRIEESFTWWLDSIGWTWLNTEVSWGFSMTKHWNLNYECYASILSIPSNIILLIMF